MRAKLLAALLVQGLRDGIRALVDLGVQVDDLSTVVPPMIVAWVTGVWRWSVGPLP